MRHEHTGEADSRSEFTSPNYRVTTTSEVEWHFVTDPVGGLAATGREAWPIEQSMAESDDPAVRRRMRKPRPLDDDELQV